MKISGPKGPQIGAIDQPVASNKSTDKASATSFKEAMQSAKPINSTENISSSLAAELAAKLKSGEITNTQAAQELIGQILNERAAGLSPSAQLKLRETLEKFLAEDPLLVGQMKKLEGVNR